jgi:hypothetical protein
MAFMAGILSGCGGNLVIADGARRRYGELMKHLIAVAAAAIVTGGCGGSSPSQPNTPAATRVQVTETFTGSTVQPAPNSCTGDTHNLSTAEGDVSVRLVSTSDPAGALSVQLCSGGIDNGNCTIRQQKITVNQTITGSRIGETTQNLKFLPHNCVFGGAPLGTAVTYSASVTYWKLQ